MSGATVPALRPRLRQPDERAGWQTCAGGSRQTVSDDNASGDPLRLATRSATRSRPYERHGCRAPRSAMRSHARGLRGVPLAAAWSCATRLGARIEDLLRRSHEQVGGELVDEWRARRRAGRRSRCGAAAPSAATGERRSGWIATAVEALFATVSSCGPTCSAGSRARAPTAHDASASCSARSALRAKSSRVQSRHRVAAEDLLRVVALRIARLAPEPLGVRRRVTRVVENSACLRRRRAGRARPAGPRAQPVAR